MQFNQGTGVFTANQTRIFDLALGLLGHNNSIVKEDQMSLEGLLILLLIGLIAGWLAGIVMKGGGYGIVGDIIIGILGSLVGGFLFSLLGLGASGFLGSVIVAFIGAVVLIFIMRRLVRVAA